MLLRGGRSAVLSGDAAPRHAIVAYTLGCIRVYRAQKDEATQEPEHHDNVSHIMSPTRPMTAILNGSRERGARDDPGSMPWWGDLWLNYKAWQKGTRHAKRWHRQQAHRTVLRFATFACGVGDRCPLQPFAYPPPPGHSRLGKP
jgi:hypothetical protein